MIKGIMTTKQKGYEAPEVEIVAINGQAGICQASLQNYDYEDEPGWFNRN